MTEGNRRGARVNGIHLRRELGEWLGGTGALTPVPQAQPADSTAAKHANRKGALAMTMPWARPLCASGNAVQLDTLAPAGGA